MAFVLHDAGRAASKHPKQRNDCTVRSLALVTGLSYDEAFEILKKAGRKSNAAFDIEKFLRRNPVGPFIFYCEKMRYYPSRSKRRLRISDFANGPPEWTGIVSTAGHVFAMVNGRILDDKARHFKEDRPVYGWMTPLRHDKGKTLYLAKGIRPPIKLGGRYLTRPLGLVSANTEGEAMGVAQASFEHQLKPREDLYCEHVRS